MSDEIDSYIADLDAAFELARAAATAAADEHNARLPRTCPTCSEPERYVHGLPCGCCGEKEEDGWRIVVSTDWGFAVHALGKGSRQRPVATYNVDM